MSTPVRVCHLTSVHSRDDVRIFHKQAVSLARQGYDVVLLVADGKGGETVQGVRIESVANLAKFGRMIRIFSSFWLMLIRAKGVSAAVYHFHDPELIPVGLVLRLLGAKVVYDVHEDVPRDILTKEWIPAVVRRPVSRLVEVVEKFSTHFFNAVCAATPFIGMRFSKLTSKVVVVNNYPILDELSSAGGWGKKQNQVCYIGGLTRIRGMEQIVSAMELVSSGSRLMLAGRFGDSELEEKVKGDAGWRRIGELGWLDRKGVCELLERSFAGLVLFLPCPNHLDAQPNKIFEYMSAGIPVIASDFPLWREIIEGSDCGLCIDPEDPVAIAESIDYLATHQEKAREMGGNGAHAVREKYNWSLEEAKLLELYESLCRGVVA